MDQIIGLVTQYTKPRNEDEFLDRLNFQYTSYIFAFSALAIGYNTYFGTAISCWTPAEFKKGWIEYTRDYCLIENTYYVPLEDPDMPNQNYRENGELTYYQWVQFILVFLAFLFYLPYLFWSTVNWWSGLQVRSVVKAACELDKIDEAKRKAGIEKIASHLAKYLDRQEKKTTISFVPNSIGRNWVAWSYVLTKFLFVINIIAQMILIHTFLGFKWNEFFTLRVGFSSNWIATGIFPRQTMCDFEVRNKGNVQKYSVQCVLSMNMLNEKIFLALFYWLIVLFILTTTSLITSIGAFFRYNNRTDFFSRMLGSYEDDHQPEKRPFIDRPADFDTRKPIQLLSTSPDLAVALHLIAKNAGDNVCSSVVLMLAQKIPNRSH